MTDSETPQAWDNPNQAKPGPHPHEAADIKRNAGDIAKADDPMDGYRDVAEPDQADPGQ